MKKIVLFSVLVSTAFFANAQTVKLKKGQTLTISKSVLMEIDMGMAGQMNNDLKSTSVIEVKDADKSTYKATTKVSKLKMNINAMGEEHSYDSEKPEDKDGEIGKGLGDNIGKESAITIESSTGKVIAEKKDSPEREEKADDPMSSIMNMGNNENPGAEAESVIYVLPAGKKAGDSWMDSSEIKSNAKIYKTYTLKSIQDDIATISVASKNNSKSTVEAQGMPMDITMDMKIDTEMTVDTKTSIVKKINRTINIDGTMEIMGQSLPISSKSTEIVEVN